MIKTLRAMKEISECVGGRIIGSSQAQRIFYKI